MQHGLPIALIFATVACPPVTERAVPVMLPFQFIRHEVVVKARVDGQGPFEMLLDTGTAPSVIDLKLARQIGLKLDPVGGKGDAGGRGASSFYETTLLRVNLGGLAATKVAALASDLSFLSKKFGRPIQGVLGDSLLTGRVVQFDYPARVVRFYNSCPDFRNRHSFALPFAHESEVHLRDVRINGQPVVANLDTGSDSAFSLTPRGIRKLRLQQAVAHARVKHGASYNGSFESRAGKVKSIQIGSIRLPSPRVVFWMIGTGHDSSSWDVNVGNHFLQNYVITIDYRRNLVTFERHRRRATGPLPPLH